MNVGEKIKKTRLLKNMKQSDLADKAEVSRVAIGNYERNERTPTVDVIVRIARALGVNPNYLVDWDVLYPDAALQVNKYEKFVEYLKSIGFDITEFSEPCMIPIENGLEEFKEEANDEGMIEMETFSIAITDGDESIVLTEEEFSQLQEESKNMIEHQLWKFRKDK